MLNDLELGRLLKDYIEKYGSNHSKKALEWIKHNFFLQMGSRNADNLCSSIYGALGLLPDNQNKWKGYFEFLKNKYNITTDILEIACGFYPLLSSYIDEEQRKNNVGTITAMDPLLVTTELGDIKLRKEHFSSDIDIRPYKLLIGCAPCKATTDIIQAANKENKDFSIFTCSCFHPLKSDLLYLLTNSIEWEDYLYELAHRDLDSSRTIDIDYLNPSNYPFVDTPIISSRKKVEIR